MLVYDYSIIMSNFNIFFNCIKEQDKIHYVSFDIVNRDLLGRCILFMGYSMYIILYLIAGKLKNFEEIQMV